MCCVLRVATMRSGEECILMFSHLEVLPGLTCNGIWQVNLDQMNPRMMTDTSFCSLELQVESPQWPLGRQRQRRSARLQVTSDEVDQGKLLNGAHLDGLARI